MALPALPQPETVGSRIRWVRDYVRRISQRELAERVRDLGVPLSHFQLTRIESDQRRPKIEELLAIAVVLAVKVSELGATEKDYPSLKLYRDQATLAHIRWSSNPRPDQRKR